MNAKRKWIAIIAALAAIVIAAVMFLVIPMMKRSIDSHIFREDAAVMITSPDNRAVLMLRVVDGRLHYRVERDGQVFMKDSPLGVTLGSDAYGTMTSIEEIGAIKGSITDDPRAINGRYAVADKPHVRATVAIDADPAFTLEVAVFNNGAAFRYILPDGGHRSLKSEQTGFALPADSAVWAGEAHQYYETVNKYYDPSVVGRVLLGTPATVKLNEGGYTAILEGDLKAYPGMKLAWASKNTYAADFDSNGSFTMDGEVTTPWRIVAVADDLNELVNNTILYQVCEKPDSDLYSDDWVQPGRAAWSWITGRTTDRVTPAIMEEYTDYAARLGFEYNIIDEGWVNWASYQSKLEELAEQGEEFGVGQILWTGVTAGASFGGGIDSVEDAYAFIDLLDELGMEGGKIDFFTTENNVEMGVDIYRAILEYAAEKELVINFHGCNKPTGYDATYPNELNREAILGLESTTVANRKIQAQMFTTQPFVRNLAGHADYTPAVDTAFHMAQLVLTDAPMQAIGSDPADILASPALEMIKSVPTVWEETVVLPQSAIGQAAVIARKSAGGSWFVGGINSTSKEDILELDLSLFLGEGSYTCEIWTDKNGKPVSETRSVTAEDTLTLPFGKLTGFILRFDRVTLSQYGGEIGDAVTVTVSDPAVTVAYSFDNGDKATSYKTVASGESITLTESGTLAVKITKGPDKGAILSYRFNNMG